MSVKVIPASAAKIRDEKAERYAVANEQSTLNTERIKSAYQVAFNSGYLLGKQSADEVVKVLAELFNNLRGEFECGCCYLDGRECEYCSVLKTIESKLSAWRESE